MPRAFLRQTHTETQPILLRVPAETEHGQSCDRKLTVLCVQHRRASSSVRNPPWGASCSGMHAFQLAVSSPFLVCALIWSIILSFGACVLPLVGVPCFPFVSCLASFPSPHVVVCSTSLLPAHLCNSCSPLEFLAFLWPVVPSLCAACFPSEGPAYRWSVVASSAWSIMHSIGLGLG